MNWYDSISEDQKKLDAIQHQHVSDEARLKAVLEVFLLGEGSCLPTLMEGADPCTIPGW